MKLFASPTFAFFLGDELLSFAGGIVRSHLVSTELFTALEDSGDTTMLLEAPCKPRRPSELSFEDFAIASTLSVSNVTGDLLASEFLLVDAFTGEFFSSGCDEGENAETAVLALTMLDIVFPSMFWIRKLKGFLLEQKMRRTEEA